MKTLIGKKWFYPALFALLFLLCALFLWIFSGQYMRQSHNQEREAAIEEYYSALFYSPLYALAENIDPPEEKTYHFYGNIIDNCGQQRLEPLYPLAVYTVQLIFPGASFFQAVSLVNSLLILLILLCIFLTVRGFISDYRIALLPPLLYGFSGAAIYHVSAANPYVLSALFCALFIYAFSRTLRGHSGFLSYALLFISVLGGLLAQYQFPAFALCVAGFYGTYSFLRRRRSLGLSLILITLAGAIGGGIFFPACLDYFFGSKAAPLLPVSQSFRGFFRMISARLFGGYLLPFLLISGILLLVGLLLRSGSRKKQDAEENPEQVPDSAMQAYRRRMERRTARQPSAKKVRRPQLPAEYVFYIFTLVSIAAYLAVISLTQSFPEEYPLFFLYPLLLTLAFCGVYRLIPLLGGTRFACVLIAAGILLMLSVISVSAWGMQGFAPLASGYSVPNPSDEPFIVY